MDSSQEDSGQDVVTKAIESAEIARLAKKKDEKAAKEALEVVCRELKRKGKIIESRKKETHKKTVTSYFQSSRGSGAGQPLCLVFNGSMSEIPGTEPTFGEEYQSDKYDGGQISARCQSTAVSIDTAKTPNSSLGSRDTIVVSSKSPLITISKESKVPENSKLLEVPIDFEGSDEDSEFHSSLSKRGANTHD